MHSIGVRYRRPKALCARASRPSSISHRKARRTRGSGGIGRHEGHFSITLFPSRRNASKTPCASRDPYLWSDSSCGTSCMRYACETDFLSSVRAFYASRVARVVGSSSSDGLSRLLLFERHRYRRVCREANPSPLDVGDQPEVDEMRVLLVLTLAAVALGEPDATVGDTVDGADVNAVRAGHFQRLDG